MIAGSCPEGRGGKASSYPPSPLRKTQGFRYHRVIEKAELGSEFCSKLPSPKDFPFTPCEGELVVFPDHLHVGLRWPLAPKIVDFCHHLRVALTQLSSNSWRDWLSMFPMVPRRGARLLR